MLQLSQYLQVRRREEWCAVFHALHPEPLYYLKRDWDTFLVAFDSGSGYPALLEQLQKRQLVVASTKKDQEELEKARTFLGGKLNQARILYLVLAQGCNFDCVYCPLPKLARQKGESMLSLEDAQAGLELWAEHVWDKYDQDEDYHIIFYGGEPLLNKETFGGILPHIVVLKEKGRLPENLSLMVVTNGALVDSSTIELFKQYGVGVVVGLDGPKEINDQLRVDKGGAGTYDTVVGVIANLVDSGVKTFISTSITPHNIKNLSSYSSFFEQLGIVGFGFNFLKGKSLLELIPRDEIEKYYTEAAQGVLENYGRQNQEQKESGYEYQMEKKRAAFFDKDYFPFDCTCYGSQLVILPTGQISNCPFAQAELGHVKEVGQDFRIWETNIVRSWRERLPLYNEKYQSSSALGLCGGGCAWGVQELTGDLKEVDSCTKTFSEKVLDSFIWYDFDSSQGETR